VGGCITGSRGVPGERVPVLSADDKYELGKLWGLLGVVIPWDRNVNTKRD
jgi:hypothetical protein